MLLGTKGSKFKHSLLLDTKGSKFKHSLLLGTKGSKFKHSLLLDTKGSKFKHSLLLGTKGSKFTVAGNNEYKEIDRTDFIKSSLKSHLFSVFRQPCSGCFYFSVLESNKIQELCKIHGLKYQFIPLFSCFKSSR